MVRICVERFFSRKKEDIFQIAKVETCGNSSKSRGSRKRETMMSSGNKRATFTVSATRIEYL